MPTEITSFISAYCPHSVSTYEGLGKARGTKLDETNLLLVDLDDADVFVLAQ